MENQSDQTTIPASHYTFAELASIYNDSRVDYIVPMPMNARRMEEYVRNYDVDLDASAVSLNADGEITGIGMLGLRDERGWITRLGVIPANRGRKTGLFLMHSLLHQAQSCGAKRIQLEVIEGNEPAYRLFLKLGFRETRELMIIRRPPGVPRLSPPLPNALITPLAPDEIALRLNQRLYDASWVEESQSILQGGNLKGFEIALEAKPIGWIIFQAKPFQLEHVVYYVPPEMPPQVTAALLYHLHAQYSTQDTKIENVPVGRTFWPVFQDMGYVEAFRRLEMVLDF
jgi:ribosomal protein S18 acetylase RimI-like enzyme